MMRESVPALRSQISVLKLRPTVLIVDLFGTEALPLADELNMLNYVLIASNAWFLAATTYFPTIDGKQEDEHIIQQKPLIIPGLQTGLEIPAADGILVNTWEDLEAKTLQSMRDTKMLGRVTRVPIYPIGPLVREVKSPALENPVLDWLDNQPTESVIYVSFGSGGTLSAKQMTELAWGLELSQQRFIWSIVERKEIETLVRSIMVDEEGNKIRSRVKELKSSAEKALSKGGSSYNSLSRVAEDCEKSLQGLVARAHGA
ncbi:hypothetical protein Patl1_28878 [Pistacia atlantica]|uniref:Uncharacterized protein n=1 Tax=Pistacia atlantica TaxID=434234 RepID=A0ACC1BH06_9ROSI|nr:hypothetical protein Patl1_28878 [Pistacia atlantica]